jgi:hypothetical protein
MRVTVSAWPSSGCPNGRNVSVSYIRTAACFIVVALHAVANSLRDEETPMAIDCRSRYSIPGVHCKKAATEINTYLVAVAKYFFYLWP